MRDYSVSLACQVDFAQDNPSRKTPQVLAVPGLRNHTTIEISLPFGPGMYVDDKGGLEDRNEFVV